MKKVKPYKTVQGAIKALDNGGRFYNLASKANDGNITPAELAKAAGVVSNVQSSILYLEMSLMALDEGAKNQVLSHLSGELKIKYESNKPQLFTPASARSHAENGRSAIITGIPTLVDSKTQFFGFIMIPIVSGSVTTFAMVPLIDEYDIYELRDSESEEDCFIAHKRGFTKLSAQLTRCGGMIKELKAKPEEEQASGKFLEMTHYSPVDP